MDNVVTFEYKIRLTINDGPIGACDLIDADRYPIALIRVEGKTKKWFGLWGEEIDVIRRVGYLSGIDEDEIESAIRDDLRGLVLTKRSSIRAQNIRKNFKEKRYMVTVNIEDDVSWKNAKIEVKE